MSSTFENKASAYFEEQLGLTLDALLAPIEASQPVGRSLRGSSAYSAIEQARRQDDPSLPMGHWEYELKRADWKKVSSLCANALASQSKDLQLAAWLLEAQINQAGFTGIAACLCLLENLSQRYWQQIYPKIDDGDLEYRSNIFRWMNDKLLIALRLVPITASGKAQEYSWSDLELARRNEQAIAAKVSKANEASADGMSSAEMNSSITNTATDAYTWLRATLSDAVYSINSLSTSLDQLFGDESPSMAAMKNLLEQILAFVEAELHKRGVRPASAAIPAAATTPEEAKLEASLPSRPADLTLSHGVIRDRADAYARLAETAEFLMRLEPHSPVPYLIRRATEWGCLNTVELYQELFLKLGGQLNIFEMLGLDAQEKACP